MGCSIICLSTIHQTLFMVELEGLIKTSGKLLNITMGTTPRSPSSIIVKMERKVTQVMFLSLPDIPFFRAQH
uniref:Uncharacterized protein n=1 Tax=Arundo donax TaxID=35708 RepID=A0A0A9CM62_ARUDO